MADSVGLDSETPRWGAAGSRANPSEFGLKQALLLFVVFILSVSDFFLHHVVATMPGAVDGRHATNSGILAQGVVMVLLYAVLLHLDSEGIL
jgi:hypothetical protein